MLRILLYTFLVEACHASGDMADDTCVLQKAVTVAASTDQSLKADAQVQLASTSAQKDLLRVQTEQHIWAYGIHPNDVLNASFLDAFVHQIDIELYDTNRSKPVRNKLVFVMLQLLVLPAMCGVDRCFMGQTALGVVKALSVGGLGFWTALDSLICLFNCLTKDTQIDLVGFKAEWEEASVKPAFYLYVVFFVIAATVCCCACCCFPIILGATAFQGALKDTNSELVAGNDDIVGGGNDTMVVGGAGPATGIDEETKLLCVSLSGEVLVKAQASGWNGVFVKFEPVQASKQVVAGINYYVKVLVSDTSAAHVHIFQPLPNTGESASVVSVKVDQDPAADIEPF